MVNCCAHCVASGRCPSVPFSCPACPERYCLESSVSDLRWSRCDCRTFKGWFDKNRNLIWVFRWHLDCSPEFIQYFLLKLLFSNFGQLVKLNGPNGRSLYFPLTGALDEHQKNIFNSWGNLKDPLKPSNLTSILKVIREHLLEKTADLSCYEKEYIYKNGLLAYLGPEDPLVPILQSLNTNVECTLNLDNFLEILLRYDPKDLVKTLPKRKQFKTFRDIEKLYLHVVMPPKLRDFYELWDSSSSASLGSNRFSGFSNTSELLEFQKLFNLIRRKKPKKSIRASIRRTIPPIPKIQFPYFWFKPYPSNDSKNYISAGKYKIKKSMVPNAMPTTATSYKYDVGYGYVTEEKLKKYIAEVSK